MSDSPTTRQLRARVEASPGPLDDETLGRVICAVLGVEFGHIRICTGDDGSDELNVYKAGAGHWSGDVWSGYRRLAPDVSIDAAVGMIERGRPGWGAEVNIGALPDGETKYQATLFPPVINDDVVSGVAAAPALAILAALLRALEAEHVG